MTRLALVSRPTDDPAADALRALAVALRPLLQALDVGERHDSALVDVVATVPAPKRSVMRACREGRIAGAVCVGRRWVAPRQSVNKWLESLGPRGVTAADDDDDLEPLRRSLCRAEPRRARRR